MGTMKDPNQTPDLSQALRESEQRLQNVMAHSGVWYWEQDENCRFTLITDSTQGQSGPDPTTLLGKALWEAGAVAPADGGDWGRHRAVLQARQPFTDFVYKCVIAKEGQRYISANGTPMFDEAGRFLGYRGTAKDITQRVQIALRLAIEHAVTRALEESNSMSEAAPLIIRVICESLGWSCGAHWALDEGGQSTCCTETWGVTAPRIDAFLETTRRQAPSTQAGGLNRRTWSERKPTWIHDVTQEATFRRAPDALKAGLYGAFAFPINVGAQVFGVLEFFSDEIPQPDAELFDCMSYVGSQIGQFVQRKQAQEELRRFRTAMDASADMIVLIDRATMRFVDVNETTCQLLGYTRDELLQMGPQDLLPVSREDLERTYDAFIANPANVSGMQSQYRCKNGSLLAFESTRRVLRSGNRDIIAAVSRDTSARRRQEQLRTLEHTVTRSLAVADSAAAAITAAIQTICETEGWECGRYFSPDDKAGVLFLGEAWGLPNPAIDRYIAGSKNLTYTSGVGLVGLVWQTGQPLWVADLYADARVSQAPLARESGIHGAFVFPIASQGKAIGVLVFNSREVREPEERLLQAISVIGSQIGQFISRKQAEDVVRENEERFRALADLSSDLYWEQNDKFRFTSMKGSGSARVSAANNIYIGRTRWEQRYVNMRTDDWVAHIALLEAHQPFRDLELCRLDPSGNKIWISVSGAPVFDQGGVFKGYRGVGKDITERKRVEERIEHMANHDALTALPNRVMFSEMVNLSLQNAKRYHRHFAVLFIDLDRFKLINDSLGHEAGDQLLQEIGRRLTQVVRTSDVVARLGGDEFVVLIQEVGETQQVEAVARKILSALVTPMVIQGQECRVTASIGICMYPTDAQDEQSLMKNADTAMYRAKEEGKNTYKFYSKDFNTHSFERLALETSLRRGLERNEFFVHYQAKLDLNTRQITGVEALVRWQHPDLGTVPPTQFIPLAEETGLIVPLGKWVLDTACAQNMAWQRSGLPPMRMAVNLSARQFADDDLLEHIAEALQTSGMAPELLELELTESMVMQNAERAGMVLADIKRLGVRLAIDDFGVGYSSLTHLKSFPIDTLKVDRSFIRDLPQNAEDRALTEAIIAMGKSLKLKVVAEGVETLEQEDFLREHNCDESQGYFFSKPIAGDRFAELLRDHLALKK